MLATVYVFFCRKRKHAQRGCDIKPIKKENLMLLSCPTSESTSSSPNHENQGLPSHSSCPSESLPHNRDWDILSIENHEVTSHEQQKNNASSQSFVDEEPYFCDDTKQLHTPRSLSGIDRVAVMSRMQEMRARENQ